MTHYFVYRQSAPQVPMRIGAVEAASSREAALVAEAIFFTRPGQRLFIQQCQPEEVTAAQCMERRRRDGLVDWLDLIDPEDAFP